MEAEKYVKIENNKRLYTVKESYQVLYDGMRTIKYFLKAKKKKELDSQFIERIMLAVTEVNDCPACSFMHTKMALETGMENEEIQKMLSGTFENIPKDELAAIMFAQHYAESKGHPSKKSWDEIVTLYGKSKAMGILGAIRMIMMGNVYGITIGSFINRFKGKSDSRSNIWYELSMMISAIFFFPIVFIHILISYLFRTPIIVFGVSDNN